MNSKTHFLLALAATSSGALAQTPIYALRGSDVEGQFGQALAALDDVNGDGVRDFAVAAPRRETDPGGGGAPLLGAVVAVSGRTGAVLWTRSGAADGSSFGADLVAVSDLDQDGLADLAVGITGAFPFGPPAAIEIVSSANGVTLSRIEVANSSLLGSVLVAVDDADGDGLMDILSQDGQGTGPGQARLYSTGTGLELARFEGVTFDERFGAAIAEIDDVDGDGRRDYAFGAPSRSIGGANRVGAVAIYSSATRQLLRTIEGTRQNGAFGSAIASHVDLDGDGIDELAVVEAGVAIPLFTFTSGAVRIVSPVTGQTLRLFEEASLGMNLIGAGIGSAGDIDRDGVVDLAIGVPTASGSAADGGGISVRSGATGIEVLRYESFYESARVGRAILALDDLNADGLTDLVIAGRGAETTAQPNGPQPAFGRVIALASPPAPVYSYCEGTVANSTGESASMDLAGSTSIGTGDLSLIANGLPLQSFGYFLVSDTPNLAPNPGGGPMLCVGGAIGRLNGPGQVRSSGTTGRIEVAVDLTNLPSPTGFAPAQPFTTLYFQCWHRDMAPGLPSNFSDGLGAVILP